MITDPKVPGEEVALDRADPALPRVDQGESGLEEGEVLFDRAHRTPVRPEHVRGRGHQGPVLLDDQPDMAPGITDEHLALRASGHPLLEEARPRIRGVLVYVGDLAAIGVEAVVFGVPRPEFLGLSHQKGVHPEEIHASTLCRGCTVLATPQLPLAPFGRLRTGSGSPGPRHPGRPGPGNDETGRSPKGTTRSSRTRSRMPDLGLLWTRSPCRPCHRSGRRREPRP